jgi:hypothetical protein
LTVEFFVTVSSLLTVDSFVTLVYIVDGEIFCYHSLRCGRRIFRHHRLRNGRTNFPSPSCTLWTTEYLLCWKFFFIQTIFTKKKQKSGGDICTWQLELRDLKNHEYRYCFYLYIHSNI